MFARRTAFRTDEKQNLDALGRSLAMIAFKPDGTIITANQNFCDLLGYELSELRGRPHRMVVDPAQAASPDYQAFWAKLARGDHDAGEYKRIAKGGREVWIRAFYNPVLDRKGRVARIVKAAADITSEKLRAADCESRLDAISRVQAVIEFTLDGEIVTANQNFLDRLGYSLDEIKGRHHRMFVEESYARSADYAEFWALLKSGQFISRSFKRIARDGREVWIQASYNPIFDMNGRPTRIIKYASDITDLMEIGAGLKRLADNDLTRPITVPFSLAFEQLRSDFNGAQGNMTTALREVMTSADVIRQESRQISTAASDLSLRTERQAASLEETAAALDQITATVRQSSEGVHHAREVVKAADADAATGARVVGEAVAAMGAIARSAQQITQIVGVIDEIAFQTNLLALNAGVEAARAGEAGRGFAVVASEVRALAQRSAEAAKEIKTLIAVSGSAVDSGVRLVSETGLSLEKIAVQVKEISAVMENITVGAKEQATALTEVNTAINQMDQMTQENAAMVDETTTASQGLAGEAEELKRLIDRFRVGEPAAGAEDDKAKPVPARRAPPTRPVAMLKSVGRDGAARRMVPAASNPADDWLEF